MPAPPSIQLGSEKITLPNGKVVEVPKAFLDRIAYDLSVSGQRGKKTPAEMLMRRDIGYKMKERARKLSNKGKQVPIMYSDTARIERALAGFTQEYAGKSRAIKRTPVGQKAYDIAEARKRQRQQLHDYTAAQPAGTSRPVRVIQKDVSGRTISDTGQQITGQQIKYAFQETRKSERQLQNALKADIQEFQRTTSKSVVSNVPIKVIRSNNPDVRGSMARQLNKLGAIAPQMQA